MGGRMGVDREKVLQAMEHCDLCGDMPNCPECAYLREPGCREMLKRDIVALLKAQEPVVISWQDAESMRLCWVETRFPHTISPADLIHYFDESPNITVYKIHQNAIDWPLDEYGIKWRCWDKEPTDEQMEVVKWES